MANYTGTTGDDLQAGSGHDDTFNYAQGGHDKLTGKNGNDTFIMGDKLDAPDKINGGNDYDTVQVSTAGTLTVNFGAKTLIDVEALQTSTGNYHFVTHNGNVAAGKSFAVLASAATTMFFDGSAELDGWFNMDTSAGNDTLIGGQLADFISGGSTFFSAGNDVLDGQNGDDILNMFDDFTKTDTLRGGAGYDTVRLDGNYFAGVTFLATTMTGVEEIDLDTQHGAGTYRLVFHDGNLATGETLKVVANTAAGALIDGGLETTGKFQLYGGTGFDDMFGGGGDDLIQGAGEADLLGGGGGDDTFLYDSAAESTGPNYDTILGFNAGDDKFNVVPVISAVEAAVTHGTLTDANFDNDLVARITNGRMGANHAVLYQPDSGDHVGDTFLIVDLNNTAGYQAGADLVIWLDDWVNLSLTASNFI